jgi:hypothetical protein
MVYESMALDLQMMGFIFFGLICPNLVGKISVQISRETPTVFAPWFGRIRRNENQGFIFNQHMSFSYLAFRRFICFIFSPWNKDPKTKRGRRRPHRWRRCSRCRLWDPTKCSASNPLQCPFGPENAHARGLAIRNGRFRWFDHHEISEISWMAI